MQPSKAASVLCYKLPGNHRVFVGSSHSEMPTWTNCFPRTERENIKRKTKYTFFPPGAWGLLMPLGVLKVWDSPARGGLGRSGFQEERKGKIYKAGNISLILYLPASQQALLSHYLRPSHKRFNFSCYIPHDKGCPRGVSR